MAVYKFTRKELKKEKASSYKHGDIIGVGKYTIFIRYTNYLTEYKTPALLSFVEKEHKATDCTPGVRNGRPYYIDDFISR